MIPLKLIDDCCPCIRGESLLDGTMNMAAKTATVWVNASVVVGKGYDIVSAQGGDIGVLSGWWQSIVIVEAYDIIDTSEEEPVVVGVWQRTTTTTHVGDPVVITEEGTSKTVVVVEDDSPTNPNYIINTDINDDASSVAANDGVEHSQVISFLKQEIEAAPWLAVESSGHLGPLDAGWSGIWSVPAVADSAGFAVGSKVAWMPMAFVRDTDGSFSGCWVASGAMSVPLAWSKKQYSWEENELTEEKGKIKAPWRAQDSVFAPNSPTSPADWWVLPFDEDNAWTVELIPPAGNLWPLF